MLATDEGRDIYVLEKLLEELPGKPSDIYKDLLALLKDSKAKVAAERASHIKHIRYYLEDNKISALMRRVIQAKIDAFSNPPINQLPADVLMYTFSFFSPRERLQLTSVCNKWRVIANDRNYWLNQLIRDVGVKREGINDIAEPHHVYQRFKNIKILFRKIRIVTKFMGSFPILFPQASPISLLHALDCIDKIHKYYKIADKASWSFGLTGILLLATASLSGCLPLVQYLINTHRLNPDSDTLELAALSGNLLLVQYLINTHRLIPYKSTFIRALLSGSLSLVQYLINTHRLMPDDFSLVVALLSGNLSLVKYLIKVHSLKPYSWMLNNAASSGNLSLVRYLIEVHCLKPDCKTLNAAASYGNLPLVQYLIEVHHLKLDSDTLKHAASSGNLSLVRYLIEVHCLKPDEETLTNNACCSGNLSLVQYLIAVHSLKPNSWMLNYAACCGNLSLVQYLIEVHRLKPDRETLNSATISENLSLVQYLVEACHLMPDNDMLSREVNPYAKYIISYFQHILKMPQRMPKTS